MSFLTRVESQYSVTAMDSPKIAAFRKIVDDKTLGDVEGQKVDLFSASAVIKVYDSLNPDNKKKYESMTVKKMVETALKLIK